MCIVKFYLHRLRIVDIQSTNPQSNDHEMMGFRISQ